MIIASPSKTRTSQIRLMSSRERPGDAVEDEGREEGGGGEIAGEEQLLRRKRVRIIGSKISAGDRPNPPPPGSFVAGLQRCECSFGSFC